MPASNTSRAEVKAERNASGNMARGNTEVPTPGTSSQPNLKNANPMTAEQRAARKEARKQKAAERRAKRAAAMPAAATVPTTPSTTGAAMPASGGAGMAK